MRRDPRAYLWDVREAADAIASFMQGRGFDAYAGDLMLRSAVERQLAIIGEALSQLARVDQGLAARIPELRQAYRRSAGGVGRAVGGGIPTLRMAEVCGQLFTIAIAFVGSFRNENADRSDGRGTIDS
jgi:hypothetical protein